MHLPSIAAITSLAFCNQPGILKPDRGLITPSCCFRRHPARFRCILRAMVLKKTSQVHLLWHPVVSCGAGNWSQNKYAQRDAPCLAANFCSTKGVTGCQYCIIISSPLCSQLRLGIKQLLYVLPALRLLIQT